MISTPKTFYKIFGIGFAKRVKKAISEKENEMAYFSIVKKDEKISLKKKLICTMKGFIFLKSSIQK